MSAFEELVINNINKQISEITDLIVKRERYKRNIKKYSYAISKLVAQSNNSQLMTYWMKIPDKIFWTEEFDKTIGTWPDSKDLNIFQMLSRYTGIEIQEFSIDFN